MVCYTSRFEALSRLNGYRSSYQIREKLRITCNKDIDFFIVFYLTSCTSYPRKIAIAINIVFFLDLFQ